MESTTRMRTKRIPLLYAVNAERSCCSSSCFLVCDCELTVPDIEEGSIEGSPNHIIRMPQIPEYRDVASLPSMPGMPISRSLDFQALGYDISFCLCQPQIFSGTGRQFRLSKTGVQGFIERPAVGLQ